MICAIISGMSDPTIVVEDVRKQFGEVVALDGVSFAVEAGTVLGLLGPNGAGKTTAVRILTTILPVEHGRASVLGIDVARYPESVRLRIGLAGQYAAVDEVLTGRENLRLVGRLCHLPNREAAARADELLGRFGLSDAGDRSLKTYSGGMRRRLDLAAALVHRPPVLFLDEPTTGLDPGSRLDLWAIIGELVAEGTTVLLTTQYLEEADRRERGAGPVHIVQRDRDLDVRRTDAPFELRRGALGDHAAVVDHDDLVRESVGLFEVLRGEQHRGAVGDQLADDRPQIEPRPWIAVSYTHLTLPTNREV